MLFRYPVAGKFFNLTSRSWMPFCLCYKTQLIFPCDRGISPGKPECSYSCMNQLFLLHWSKMMGQLDVGKHEFKMDGNILLQTSSCAQLSDPKISGSTKPERSQPQSQRASHPWTPCWKMGLSARDIMQIARPSSLRRQSKFKGSRYTSFIITLA